MLISRERAYSMAGSYICDLENAKKEIRRNFNEMDLENVKLLDDMEDFIAGVEADINMAITKIEAIHFAQ